MTGSFHSHVTNTVREITGRFSFDDIPVYQGQNPLGRAVDGFVATPNGYVDEYDSFRKTINTVWPRQ